jgi:hypothetical protein
VLFVLVKAQQETKVTPGCSIEEDVVQGLLTGGSTNDGETEKQQWESPPLCVCVCVCVHVFKSVYNYEFMCACVCLDSASLSTMWYVDY